MYTYNFKASGVAWLLAHVLATLYCVATKPSVIDLNYQLRCFAAVVLLPMAVQFLVLVYGLPLLPRPSVFLDKVCINQNHVQRRGSNSRAAARPPRACFSPA